MNADDIDEAALSPEQMLALLTDQRKSMEGQIAAFVPFLVTLWGVVWFVGFTALWLIDGLQPAFGLPLPIAATIFAVLIVGAIGVSAYLGIRSNRGIRTTRAAAFTGTVYGVTWSVGSFAIFLFAMGLQFNGMTGDAVNIFYPTAFVLFAGIMYLIAGAIWQAVPCVILGAYTVVIAVIAPFLGYPNHYLFLAIAGGGGFIALGVVSFVYLARLRRRAQGIR